MDVSMFPNKCFSSDGTIAIGQSIEAGDVSRFFFGRKPGEITLRDFELSYPNDAAACLAFMVPEAFAFFLPSFLRISLDDYDEANAIPEVVIGYLLAIAKGEDVERRHAIQETYSKEQLRAVAKFLREMSAKYWRFYPNDDAQEALELFWSQFE